MIETRILNDLAILGLPSKKIAYVETTHGKFPVEIDTVGVQLSPEEIEKLKEDFRNSIVYRDFEFGKSYSFYWKVKGGENKSLDSGLFSIYELCSISSSIEELWEMFKAERTGQSIPERKCYLVEVLKKNTEYTFSLY